MRSCGTAEDEGAPTVASAGYEAVIRAADEGDPRYQRTAQGDILLVATGEYLRTSPRPGPPVRAWHGVIPRAADRAALQADAIALLQPRPGGAVGQDRTFWIDYFQGHSSRMGEEVRRTRCSLERLALDVLEFHTRADGSVEGGHAADGDAPHRVRGVEWWVQVRTPGGQPSLNLHFDADEEHKNHAGEHIPPWLATVTYLGSCGAPTLILPVVGDGTARVRPRDAGEQEGEGGSRGAFVSHPREGKHLAFDGRLLHGAIDELTHPPPARAEEEAEGAASQEEDAAYTRVTLMVNVWVDHRPSRAMRLPEDAAALLSNIEGVTSFETATPVPLEAAPPSTPPSAPPVGSDEAEVGAKVAGAEAGPEWRELAVGFIPPRAVCRQFPDWRRAAEVGTPSFRALFFHPALSVRFLPWTKPSAAATAAAAAAAAATAAVATAAAAAAAAAALAAAASTVVAAAGSEAEGGAIALEATVATGCAVAAAITGVAAVAAVAGATGAAAAPTSTCASEEDALGLSLKTAALKLLVVPAASLLHYEGFEANWG